MYAYPNRARRVIVKPKNLIFICTDQLRYDALSATGNRIARTPSIDGLAARGATFHRHYTPNQICSPSRASMATGLYPRHHGVWRNGVALDERLPTLWHTLANAGFSTRAVGKLHYQPLLAPHDLGMPESLAYWQNPNSAKWHGPYYGFEHVDLVLGEANESTKAGHYADWLKSNFPEVVNLYEPHAIPGSQAKDLQEVWKSAVPAEYHYTNWIAERAADFISTRTARADPYCLFVSFPDPHHPFAPPRPYCDMFEPAKMPLPIVREGELKRMPAYLSDGGDPRRQPYIAEGEQIREQGFLVRTDTISSKTMAVAIAHTYGMIKMIDDAVGRITDAVSSVGEIDNTYILFTSDHGELLGDHGLLRKGPPPYRQLLQVPLILCGPGIPPGAEIEALTSHVDLFATLASLLGVRPPATDGLDLAPVIRGQATDVREFLLAEYHPRADPRLYNQTFVSKEWRFTRYLHEPGWEELFDLKADPWEHWNLGIDDRFKALISLLTSVLDLQFPPMPRIPNEVLGAY